MAIFQYRGINSTGKEIKTTVSAENINQAKAKIQNSGIQIISIQEQKSTAKTGPKGSSQGLKVNINDLSLMTRQLATLVKAKIPISESLLALLDQMDNPALKIIISEVRQKINEGASLAQSLNDYPKVFNNVFVNMVEAGESSGTLDIVLLRLADFTEAQVKLKNKITSSLMYPAIMACAGFGMMIFIFIFIIPKITKIFITMKKEIPLATQICIWISQFLQNYWWSLPLFAFSFVAIFKKYINSPNGMSRWHKLQLKLPIFGNLVMMINVARFCSTLATLLASGVPILTALNIVKNLISNIHMKNAVVESRTQVQEGYGLTGPLVSSGLFPPLVTHMIKLGERSGELGPMLLIVSENYQDQVNTKLDGLTSILEPIMMLAMGAAVAFIVVSVVVPMMSLNSLKH
jgi:general secretion pathway protein F